MLVKEDSPLSHQTYLLLKRSSEKEVKGRTLDLRQMLTGPSVGSGSGVAVAGIIDS